MVLLERAHTCASAMLSFPLPTVQVRDPAAGTVCWWGQAWALFGALRKCSVNIWNLFLQYISLSMWGFFLYWARFSNCPSLVLCIDKSTGMFLEWFSKRQSKLFSLLRLGDCCTKLPFEIFHPPLSKLRLKSLWYLPGAFPLPFFFREFAGALCLLPRLDLLLWRSTSLTRRKKQKLLVIPSLYLLWWETSSQSERICSVQSCLATKFPMSVNRAALLRDFSVPNDKLPGSFTQPNFHMFHCGLCIY